MLPQCKLSIDTPGVSYWSGVCFGMILALANVEPFLEDKLRACIPEGATPGQISQVIVNYIEAHPELRHKPFLVLAIEATKAAWPCR